MTHWSVADIPDQKGRLVIITGATGGLGFEVGREMAARGAEVVLAARNPAKGAEAVKKILAVNPNARVRFEPLDLSDLSSVTAFAGRFLDAGQPVDTLINNAGIMAIPTRKTTVDGFELQFGTNYLSHFALTGRLLPLLRIGQARIVQLSSIAHRGASLRLDDLQYEAGYKAWPVYQQSKLAMLMFAIELQRRSDAAGWKLTSVAAHPGYARTSLIASGPLVNSPIGRLAYSGLFRPLLEPLVSHSAFEGALPILLAATAPDIVPAGYYGPTRMTEMKGPPGPAKIEPLALDARMAGLLWSASEAMTGVTFA